jgi:glucose-1-phosphate thymidylyltransferase
LAQAFTIGKGFIGRDPVCLSLGNNIFYGHWFQSILRRNAGIKKGGMIFGYWVCDPQRYGVVKFEGSEKS